MGNEQSRRKKFTGISVSLSVVWVLHCFCFSIWGHLYYFIIGRLFLDFGSIFLTLLLVKNKGPRRRALVALVVIPSIIEVQVSPNLVVCLAILGSFLPHALYDAPSDGSAGVSSNQTILPSFLLIPSHTQFFCLLIRPRMKRFSDSNLLMGSLANIFLHLFWASFNVEEVSQVM